MSEPKALSIYLVLSTLDNTQKECILTILHSIQDKSTFPSDWISHIEWLKKGGGVKPEVKNGN